VKTYYPLRACARRAYRGRQTSARFLQSAVYEFFNAISASPAPHWLPQAESGPDVWVAGRGQISSRANIRLRDRLRSWRRSPLKSAHDLAQRLTDTTCLPGAAATVVLGKLRPCAFETRRQLRVCVVTPRHWYNDHYFYPPELR